MNIKLREATIADKIKIYEWLFYADSSILLNQLNGIVDRIPTMEEFYNEDFPDYFFTGEHPDKGLCYLIQLDENGEWVDIGTIHYTAFHLNEGYLEFDIWLKGSEYCGKGYGTKAIELLKEKITNKGYHTIIMRPSNRNYPAIKSYAKAGFVPIVPDLDRIYKPKYKDKYGSGDYGADNDEFMILQI
jgi:RimJ/RimL family protein N-acetyltransferase